MDLIAFHAWMLNDQVRMQAYRKAIFAVVRPGDVVLDVGTGSGVLAMFACQAGARLVYAVETGEIITVARQLARENGFAERIRFLRQDARELRDLEQVDVIVSELISNSGPGENMAEIINYCRDRFLRSGGKIVPERVELCLAPVDDDLLYRSACPPDTSTYGIDFSSLRHYSINLPLRTRVSPRALLASGRVAYEYQAYSATANDDFATSHTFTVERPATLHGFCSWFNALLAEGVELTNAPPSTVHWDNVFFPLQEPVPLEPGMTISLDFRTEDVGTPLIGWWWRTAVKQGDQSVVAYEQCTRFSEPRSAGGREGIGAGLEVLKIDGKLN
jgi:protein arginine N-methyltransferase 1